MADPPCLRCPASSVVRLWINPRRLWLFVAIYCVLVLPVHCGTKCGNRECSQGLCKNGHCECFPGWIGDNCDKCYGRGRLNGTEGKILDGLGNYSADTKCSWLLETGRSNVKVRFRLRHFATECGWDHLYIHDGDSAHDPLIAAYSGLLLPQDHTGPEVEFVTTITKPYLFIHFYSDAAYIMSGFNITYSVGGCLYNCSGQNGVCQAGNCVCQPQWTGPGCEQPLCPNNCSDNGQCKESSSSGFGFCQCNPGYRGPECTSEGEGLWEKEDVQSIITGRASHTATLVNNSMFVYGGYSLNTVGYKSMYRFDLEKKEWRLQFQNSMPDKSALAVRHSHTTVHYQGKLYVYGGVVDGDIRQDLWEYDIEGFKWTQLSNARHNVSGHTAHVVNGVMIVIFGYSPVFGYTSTIQEYNIGNDSWSIPNVTGALVQGGYGHSSVYDEESGLILVYGGYHSDSSSGYNLTDKLYSYSPLTRTWQILRSSGSPRYLHAAVVINGTMLVFGGNTHNDTNVSHGAKCYSSGFMAYSIKCNSWHHLAPPDLQPDVARYGHSMVLWDGSAYLFGGFNGLMLNDILKFTPGLCSHHQNETVCESSKSGVRCVWTGSACELESSASSTPAQCNPSQGATGLCPLFGDCGGCVSNPYGCYWCQGQCSASPCTGANQTSVASLEECPEDPDAVCKKLHNCHTCGAAGCLWRGKTNANPCTPSPDGSTQRTCDEPCSQQTSCEACTQRSCMWCSNMKQCVDTNSYVASFPYGQCSEWTTKPGKCSDMQCSGLTSCQDCQAHPLCGWCNHPGDTGLGQCMEGGALGPIPAANSSSVCSKDRWFFTECPLCQCNGHSTCVNGTDQCENCKDLTEGDKCQYCVEGHYGNPQNGQSCMPCECNGQADKCDRHSGVCHCRTRGVTGDRCERCDDAHKYYGNPTNGGTCYYGLLTDYQFTFNLSKPEDNNYTQINFRNVPSSPDRDVDFTLNCSGRAYINITVKYKSKPEEEVIVSNYECDLFRSKFEHKTYPFGGEENTTFLVYVYGFQTPFWLLISFSQFPKIDLVHFFVTFFSCFLSLLLIAAALWKIKHRYDSYRRRQQLIQEMQQMASRPFATIMVDFDKKAESAVGGERRENQNPADTVTRKRKKINTKPSAIALEPLYGNKAAILTLIIQLPTGDMDYAPSGQSGIAVGSALVTLGNTRKQSLEHIKGEKPKLRKHLHHTHPDACA